MIWIDLKNGRYSAKALYMDLELGNQITFLAGVIWKS